MESPRLPATLKPPLAEATPVAARLVITPGAITARSSTLRPLSGALWISAPVTDCPSVALTVSTVLVWTSTVTDSVVEPSFHLYVDAQRLVDLELLRLGDDLAEAARLGSD